MTIWYWSSHLLLSNRVQEIPRILWYYEKAKDPTKGEEEKQERAITKSQLL